MHFEILKKKIESIKKHIQYNSNVAKIKSKVREVMINIKVISLLENFSANLRQLLFLAST